MSMGYCPNKDGSHPRPHTLQGAIQCSVTGCKGQGPNTRAYNNERLLQMEGSPWTATLLWHLHCFPVIKRTKCFFTYEMMQNEV